MRRKGGTAAAVDGRIADSDRGGFLAVASTDSLDRDGEVIAPGAFNPLPDSIPCHLDHLTTASNVVARGLPYYDTEGRLMINASFGSGPGAQEARQKVAEGLVDSVSIVFLPRRWEDRDGVRTLVAGELLACDLVSVPSNRDARILAARSFGAYSARGRLLAEAQAEALLALAEVEIAEARAVLRSYGARSPGPVSRRVAADLRLVLSENTSHRRRSL